MYTSQIQDARYIRGIPVRVASGLFSWNMAGGLQAFSSRQFALNKPFNQSWTFVRFARCLYFSFLELA